MRIAMLAPLYESVPPARYGGTERVVDWLCRELVRAGHQVTLFGSGDSTTPARLVPIVERALRPVGAPLLDPVACHLLAIEAAAERASEFDVVHSHVDYLPFRTFADLPVPLLTTLHGRLDVEGLGEIYRRWRRFPLVSISYAQRRPLPDATWLANVHHGLPLGDYEPGAGRGDYFVFLGRISPEKRPHVAIDVARRLGVRLVIAAKVDAADQRYWREAVAPRLHDPRIEFVGEVDHAGKAALLRDAAGLLNPILWPEPFGLAMIESLAFGTPVITRRCGSTPEVVAHGKVGFVCDDDEDLANAVKRVDQIDRRDCRRWVEERFSSVRMTDEYSTLYERLAQRGPTMPKLA